jgi:hypothetical protein
MDIGKLKNGIEVWLNGFAGDPETRIKVRHINQDEFDRLVKASIETTFDPKTHAKAERRNEEKYRKLLVDAVVVDWEGFEEDGQPWPCTPENRAWLMEVSTDFRVMVNDTPMQLEKMLAVEREQAEKN